MKGALFALMALVLVSGCTTQAEVSLKNLATDKAVYHSAEIMNLSAQLYSDMPLNVTVVVSGIDNRFNVEKEISLEKGSNELSFTYTLPRCNVCGGIRAGDYNLSFTVRYKNISIEDSRIINIQQ
jgi:hypothetical protein